MTIKFEYMKELESFLQILILGSLLSFIVCYAVEALKNTGIKRGWFYFLASIIISALFGFGFSKAFTDMTAIETVMLSVCLWLGSQGFYEHLKQSDGFVGRAFVSLSERLQLEDIIKAEIKEETKEEPSSEPVEPTVPDDEEVDEEPPKVPEAEKRNVKANQIKVLVNDLRIRKAPNGDILGYADKNGYYT